MRNHGNGCLLNISVASRSTDVLSKLSKDISSTVCGQYVCRQDVGRQDVSRQDVCRQDVCRQEVFRKDICRKTCL